jgi:hypothetical protein
LCFFGLKISEENLKKKRKLDLNSSEKEQYPIENVDEQQIIHQFQEKIKFFKKNQKNLIFTTENEILIFNLETNKLIKNFINIEHKSKISCCFVIENLDPFTFECLYGKEGFEEN